MPPSPGSPSFSSTPCPQFQDEMGLSNVEDDGPEEEERAAEPRPSFNTPQALR